MHFQLPKPLHGWRPFAGEVGIIVLGILLALGAEQLAQTLRIRSDTAEALESVRAELAMSAGVYEERLALQPCLDRRIKQIRAVLSSARQSHRLPDVGETGATSIRPIQTAAWTSALSGGLVDRFPKFERDLMRVHYSQASHYFSDVDQEMEMWATLRVLKHQPGPIDGAMLAEAAGTLERLRYRSWLNGVDAEDLSTDIVKSMRIRPDYFMLAEDGEKLDRAAMLERVRAFPLCKPLVVDGKAMAA